MVKQANVMGKL